MSEIDPRMVKWDETPKIDPRMVKWDKEPVPVTASGVGAEIGKGLVRGASDVAMGAGSAGANLLLGPIGGRLATQGMEALAAPSRSLIQASPENPTEQFAGTASEIAGGGIAGGGAGTVRGAVMTGAGALGGATGEQMGGDLGKIIGIVAGVAGVPAAQKVWKAISGGASDIAATVGAGFGNKASIEKLARESVTRSAGESAPKVVSALEKATEYVPGAKPTAGEAITQAQMGQPEQFGGALIRLQKDLYGAKGVEDVLPTVAKQQKAAVASHIATVKNEAAPMREAALKAANASGGIDPDGILYNINKTLTTPGQRSSDVVSKTLEAIKEKINSLLTPSGKIDAADLYTVRKEIGTTIQKFSKETANWDKRLTGGLERSVQGFIDDAIEQAGGTGWKDYLRKYSEGMKGVEAQDARLKEMKLIASGVKGQPSAQLVAGEIPQPPTLLSRPMMLVNYALKAVAKDANTPVAKEIALRMQHPGEFAKLIALPPTDPKRRVAEEIAQKVLLMSAASPPSE